MDRNLNENKDVLKMKRVLVIFNIKENKKSIAKKANFKVKNCIT